MLSAETHRGNREASGAESYGRFLYNFFRTYDPSTGRYLSADPLGQESDLNVYRYALANPITNIDPEGLFVFAGAGAAGGSIGVGTSGAGAAGAIGSSGPAAPLIAAGVGGVVVGTIINQVFADQIDQALDDLVRKSKGDKWFCVATGTLVDFSGTCPNQSRCTGSAYGKTEALACRAAKRAASGSAPQGTYCRHIKCRCSKVQ